MAKPRKVSKKSIQALVRVNKTRSKLWKQHKDRFSSYKETAKVAGEIISVTGVIPTYKILKAHFSKVDRQEKKEKERLRQSPETDLIITAENAYDKFTQAFPFGLIANPVPYWEMNYLISELLNYDNGNSIFKKQLERLEVRTELSIRTPFLLGDYTYEYCRDFVNSSNMENAGKGSDEAPYIKAFLKQDRLTGELYLHIELLDQEMKTEFQDFPLELYGGQSFAEVKEASRKIQEELVLNKKRYEMVRSLETSATTLYGELDHDRNPFHKTARKRLEEQAYKNLYEVRETLRMYGRKIAGINIKSNRLHKKIANFVEFKKHLDLMQEKYEKVRKEYDKLKQEERKSNRKKK